MAASLVAALALVGLVATAAPASAEPAAGTSKADIRAARNAEPSAVSGPVTGTLQNGKGSVSGIFNVKKFVGRDGQLMAVGKFIGTITDGAGRVHAGSKQIALPVTTEEAGAAQPSTQRLAPAAAATDALSCQVLDLVLGPLDLTLVGLKVPLDTVHLNITAQGGPGNLVGNLLCAVAGLLDGGTGLNGILNQLTGILTRLLAVLG